jgi:curved DNA-binding protein CbpA
MRSHSSSILDADSINSTSLQVFYQSTVVHFHRANRTQMTSYSDIVLAATSSENLFFRAASSYSVKAVVIGPNASALRDDSVVAMPKMTKGDAYVILGLEESATEAEVKSSFKKLALRTHPDKNPNDPDASKNFHRISEAYKRITDPSSFHDEDHEGVDVSEEDIANSFSAMFHEMFRNGGNHDASGMFSFFGSDDDEDSEGRQDEMDLMRAMEIMMNNGMYDEEDEDNEDEEYYSEEDDDNFGCDSDDDEDTKAAMYNLMASLTAGHQGGVAALFAGGGKKFKPPERVQAESDSDDGDYGQDSGLDCDDGSDEDDEDSDVDPDKLFELEPRDGLEWENNKMMQTVLKNKLVGQMLQGNSALTAKEIAEGSFRQVKKDGGCVTMEFVPRPKDTGAKTIKKAAANSDDDEWETTSEDDEDESVTLKEREKGKGVQKVTSKKASANSSAVTGSASVKKVAKTGAGVGPVESAADSGPKIIQIPQSAAPSTAAPAPAPSQSPSTVKSAVATSQKAGSSTKCEIGKGSIADDKNVPKPTGCEGFAIGDRVCVNSKYVLILILVLVVCVNHLPFTTFLFPSLLLLYLCQ